LQVSCSRFPRQGYRRKIQERDASDGRHRFRVTTLCSTLDALAVAGYSSQVAMNDDRIAVVEEVQGTQ
jgi:hypothetical protein